MQETREEMAPKKAGYCVKCKKHVPVNYFVWQDGTTHPTTCNQHELEHKLASDGLRYCKVCDNFIALDLFPKTGAMSYICKKHKYAADVVRKHKETEESHPGRKRRLRQWKLCWMDSRKFKQASIGMSQHEIDLEIAKIDQKGTGQYAIMPMDRLDILLRGRRQSGTFQPRHAALSRRNMTAPPHSVLDLNTQQNYTSVRASV